jgi:nitrate/nitrite transport system ATP-binding protein
VVFQSHALMPWLSVLKNVVFAVRSRWPEWSRRRSRARPKYLEMVGLGHAIDKKPAELSGGMKQRVGIARASAIEPKMLLLDEPFGALDALTRGSIQDELLRIVAARQQTVFMITHDVDEAILLADRIAADEQRPARAHRRDRRITLPRSRTRRDPAPRPAVLPRAQPPGRLPRQPLARPSRPAAAGTTLHPPVVAPAPPPAAAA